LAKGVLWTGTYLIPGSKTLVKLIFVVVIPPPPVRQAGCLESDITK